MSEKTEPPSEKKLQDARKKGQVPSMKNSLEAFLLISGVVLVISLMPQFSSLINEVLDEALSVLESDFSSAVQSTLDAAKKTVTLTLIFILSLAGSLLLVGLLLNKFNFAPAAMKIKFSKLNPVSGIKNIFTKTTIYNFVRLLIYFSCVSFVLYFVISSGIIDMMNASSCGLRCLSIIIPHILLQMIVVILSVLVILAMVDFKMQAKFFTTQNKMSKEDQKNEHKGSEGNPEIKGERSRIAQEDAHMPTAEEVTHVIFSQKHLVAILYYHGSGSLPFVVMKASGSSTGRLLARFRSMRTCCVNLPGVARDFHGMAGVGSYMPPECAPGILKIREATGQA